MVRGRVRVDRDPFRSKVRLSRGTFSVRGRLVISAVACAAVWSVPAADAGAAPTCPEQILRTPYMTPVTTTLACTDPAQPVTRYLAFGSPSGTFTISGDQATITPGPTSSNTEVVFNYWAENAIFERTLGFLRVQVGGAPMPPPPPNRPPVARCDSYSVKPGEVLDVRRPGVLANDTDPDGPYLQAQSAYGSDPDFPAPLIEYNGRLRFGAPDRPGMFSYRYFAADGEHQTESTVTIWVGTKDKGCRPAFDPPPTGRRQTISTLLKARGAVRIRAAGRWRSLGAPQRLRRALLVDARRGSVRVRIVTKDNYTRSVLSGRFGGGLFKLGKDTKAPNGKVYSTFNTVELAGGLGCGGGGGPGRQLDVVTAGPGFFFDALRIRAYALAIRKRLVVSRFSVSDRCNETSVVQLSAGRVWVADHNKRGTILTGRGTYVARPRRPN